MDEDAAAIPVKKPTPRDWAEYVALRATGLILCLLPYRLALALGWLIARAGHAAFPGKIRTARQRIRDALGPDVSGREAARIAWLAWRNMAFNAVDMLRSPYVTKTWVRRVTDYGEIDKLLAPRRAGQNVIIATPHMGSWEVAGLSASLFDVPLLYITRQQKNPLSSAYLNRVRSRTGQKCVDRDDPRLIRTILREIKLGTVLAILPDIRARTDALHVRFLGHDVTVAAGMALFARQAGAPILPACVIRDGWAHHTWRGFDLVRPDESLEKAADWQRMTQQVLDVFGRVIREHPEQYFWFNKKWILAPSPEATGNVQRSTLNVQR